MIDSHIFHRVFGSNIDFNGFSHYPIMIEPKRIQLPLFIHTSQNIFCEFFHEGYLWKCCRNANLPWHHNFECWSAWPCQVYDHDQGQWRSNNHDHDHGLSWSFMVTARYCHSHCIQTIVAVVVRVTNSKGLLKKYEVWKETDDKCKLVDWIGRWVKARLIKRFITNLTKHFNLTHLILALESNLSTRPRNIKVEKPNNILFLLYVWLQWKPSISLCEALKIKDLYIMHLFFTENILASQGMQFGGRIWTSKREVRVTDWLRPFIKVLSRKK